MFLDTNEVVDCSVIIPIVERHDNLEVLFKEYISEFQRLGKSCEFIFVVDADFKQAYDQLQLLKKQHKEIRIIKFARNFHESIALLAGFEHARGSIIFTISAYFQVEKDVIQKILHKLENGKDLVVTHRSPRSDSIINRMQTKLFHHLVSKMTGSKFNDIACGVRGMKREVAESLELTGDMHRFIPILACQKGFQVAEVKAAQHVTEKRIRIFSIGVYVRRIIDIISLFFLIKFTRKPLRFFGLIGVNFSVIGSIILGYLAIMRLIHSMPISGRPLLLLGLLLVVLGIQVASIGLLGELIIFTHARDIKEYHVAEVHE